MMEINSRNNKIGIARRQSDGYYNVKKANVVSRNRESVRWTFCGRYCSLLMGSDGFVKF